MFKKRIALLLALALSATMILSACGNGGTDSGETQDVQENTEEPAEEPEAEPEEEETEPEVDYIQGVPYIDDGNEDHLLDIFGTEGLTEKTKTIVEVHGGGYIGGSKETNTDHSEYYKENGFVVVTPNYTHAREDTGSFKDLVQDLFAAYNWVGEHADEYNIDLEHTFLSGDSAGGFMVLLTAAIMQSEEMQQYFEVTKPSYDFHGYVATCPASDIMKLREDLENEQYPAVSIGERSLGDDELMNHMDLYSNIDPATYPYLYMLTTPGDDTTGAETQKFAQFLDDNGIAYELHSYDNQENELAHVFNISHTDWVESIQANDDIIAYLNSLCE